MVSFEVGTFQHSRCMGKFNAAAHEKFLGRPADHPVGTMGDLHKFECSTIEILIENKISTGISWLLFVRHGIIWDDKNIDNRKSWITSRISIGVLLGCPIIIPPASTKLIGGYTGITLSVYPSVRPSVRLWTESCPLCIFTNAHWIHFIFAHLIKQLQKVCRV